MQRWYTGQELTERWDCLIPELTERMAEGLTAFEPSTLRKVCTSDDLNLPPTSKLIQRDDLEKQLLDLEEELTKSEVKKIHRELKNAREPARGQTNSILGQVMREVKEEVMEQQKMVLLWAIEKINSGGYDKPGPFWISFTAPPEREKTLIWNQSISELVFCRKDIEAFEKEHDLSRDEGTETESQVSQDEHSNQKAEPTTRNYALIPPSPGEKPLTTWPEIAEFAGWSVSKAKRLREKLLEDKVIYKEGVGSPPKPRVRAWPSTLKTWITDNVD